MKIDIPSVLIHLRGRVVREEKGRANPERLVMAAVGKAFASQERYERAQRLARKGAGPLARLRFAPGATAWTQARELPDVPDQSFRDWWRTRPAARTQ